MPRNDQDDVAGRALGLPAEGQGSVARLGVRSAAVLVDAGALALPGLVDEDRRHLWDRITDTVVLER